MTDLIGSPAEELRQEIGKKQQQQWETTYDEQLPPLKAQENINHPDNGGVLIEMAALNKRWHFMEIAALAVFAPPVFYFVAAYLYFLYLRWVGVVFAAYGWWFA